MILVELLFSSSPLHFLQIPNCQTCPHPLFLVLVLPPVCVNVE